MTNAPCKDCRQRSAGCHAECQEYNDWRRTHEQEKQDYAQGERYWGYVRESQLRAYKTFRQHKRT